MKLKVLNINIVIIILLGGVTILAFIISWTNNNDELHMLQVTHNSKMSAHVTPTIPSIPTSEKKT